MTNLMTMRVQRPSKEKSWEIEEIKVIAKWAGKKILSEITILVNAISNNSRTDEQVERKGHRQGFGFKVKG